MPCVTNVRKACGLSAHRDGALFWYAALAVLSVTLLTPLLITDVPPVLDYPNHLARLVLLAAGSNDHVLGPMFTADWTIIPNLAGDVIGLMFLHVLPVHVAGRCLLGNILLLNLAGVIALHRAYFRRRSFWPLGSGLVAYNCTFLLGFLNWQISSGLAMLCAAGWLSWRERYPIATIIGAMAATVLLFFCHLMGLVFFLALIGSAELNAMRAWRDALVRCTGLLVVLVGPIVLVTLAPMHASPWAAHWPRWDVKVVNGASPLINYVLPLDVISVVVVYGGIALGVAFGWFTVAPRAVAALVILSVAYFVLPFDLMSGSFLDMRFAVMFGFMLFAAVDSGPQTVTLRGSSIGWKFRVIAAGFTLLFVVRMSVLAKVWVAQRHDLAELRAVIAEVPPGAKVFFTNIPQEEAPADWDAGPRSRRLSNGLRTDYHMPALLLIERGAFWPVLFANPSQQPIRLRPDYTKLAREAHDIPSHARLVGDPNSALPALCHFDYVLMLEAGADTDLANFVPQILSLESRSDFAALFRVLRRSPTCAARVGQGE
jgi:hypothetical protein